MPWTAAGAGEAAATIEGRAAGALRLATVASPGVEVPAGGVGLWHTRDRKE